MTNSPDEIIRRKDVMAAAARRADVLFEDITLERQTKMAESIHQSIEDAPTAVSANEAIEMIAKFDEETT